MSSSEEQKILHVITSLDTGGAEMMLYKTIKSTKNLYKHGIVVLMGEGALSDTFASLEIKICYMRARPGYLPNIRAIFDACCVVRDFAPNLIQGWMYHGNIFSWFLGKFICRRARVAFNVRQTLYDVTREKKLTRFLIWVGKYLSKSCDVVIYNSRISVQQHEAYGYENAKSVFIPNGFDCEQFSPNITFRKQMRTEFGLSNNIPVVLHVGRYHPMKDHRCFLHAAKFVLVEHPSARFIIVGRGLNKNNVDLLELGAELGILERLILAGERRDVPRLMAGADLVVSSSAWGEGFPNVIGEAMACETPIVVTDVGDSSEVVGNAGLVVPPSDSQLLGEAINGLLKDPRRLLHLGVLARRRVVAEYSIETVARRYGNVYMDLLR